MDFDDLDDLPGGRMYDIVIYGATGYSGCLMAEHLDALLSQPGATPRRWAVAGRSREKLEKLAANCKTEPGVIEAKDAEGLESMAEFTSVVINAAGPYMLCGREVVAACVEKKTQYIDISGELVWIKRMIKSFHVKARESGVMVVHCAGVMCAPEDLALYELARKLGPLRSFRHYQMEVGVGGGGGTFFSGYAGYEEMFDNELQVLTNPFSLGGERKRGKLKEDEDPTGATEDDLFPGLWLSGGHCTPASHRVLRRSCELLERDFGENLEVGDGAAPQYGDAVSISSRYPFLQAGLANKMASTTKEPKDIQGLIKHANTMKEAVRRGQYAPPGGGPTREARGEGFIRCLCVAESEAGDWAHVRVSGPDPFEATALCAVAGALVLSEEGAQIGQGERGGVVTPAYAFHGSSYLDRLRAHPFAGLKERGMTFELLEGKPAQKDVEEAVRLSDEKGSDIFSRSIKGGIEGSWAPPEMLR